jgi:diketogulonate reductase-like aldo/keto reductase
MSIPKFIYGTAWKNNRTYSLVLEAIEAGFRAFDTANQRVHYYEKGVGDAIRHALKSGLSRDELFIQTKFTYAGSQDHRIPYDPNTGTGKQVRQSFQSSLEHLGLDHLDSYILHGPKHMYDWTDTDSSAWEEMSTIYEEGLVDHLGVSNVTPNHLTKLISSTRIKPTFVQNRCFANTGWDKQVRTICLKNGIRYQGFSLLTANPSVLQSLGGLSRSIQRTPAQIIFRFSQQIGMIPLTGTTSRTHMAQDLDLGFSLDDRDLNYIENSF